MNGQYGIFHTRGWNITLTIYQVSDPSVLRIASLTFSASNVVACPSVVPISVHLIPNDCATGDENVAPMTVYFAHGNVLDIDVQS